LKDAELEVAKEGSTQKIFRGSAAPPVWKNLGSQGKMGMIPQKEDPWMVTENCTSLQFSGQPRESEEKPAKLGVRKLRGQEISQLNGTKE